MLYWVMVVCALACMVDYRLHWLAGLITAALIADLLQEAMHERN